MEHIEPDTVLARQDFDCSDEGTRYLKSIWEGELGNISNTSRIFHNSANFANCTYEKLLIKWVYSRGTFNCLVSVHQLS